MRVVFMGTPDIAATCLKKILADGFEVVGVYTQPDRPKGRGMKMVASPVKEVALQHNLPVFQPENFREEETVQQLAELKPDICAVVAMVASCPRRCWMCPPSAASTSTPVSCPSTVAAHPTSGQCWTA